MKMSSLEGGWSSDIDDLCPVGITPSRKGRGKNGWWLPNRSDGESLSERRLLINVLDTAAERQDRKRQSLETELKKNGIVASSEDTPSELWSSDYRASKGKSRRSKMLWEGATSQPVSFPTLDSSSVPTAASEENHEKDSRKKARRATAVEGILVDVKLASKQLADLRAELCSATPGRLRSLRCKMEEELGLGPLLETAEAAGMATRRHEWGRPEGFTGPVFMSSYGVPILVGGRGDSEALMRDVSQGADLWFQVRDGRGSRVLLRTSMCRGLKGSKACVQLAANLAAYFSDRRRELAVEVMYADSRKVAKRGSRAGMMRDRKKLGTVVCSPLAVAELVNEMGAL